MRKCDTTGVSRRTFIRGASAAGIGAALTGRAAAASGETERRVVGTASKAAAAAVRRRASEVIREIDLGERGYAVVGEFPVANEAAIQTQSAVEYVEPDVGHELLGHEVSGSTVEQQRTPWGVSRVKADRVHERGVTGRETHVAVIDTGIESDHPDLQGNLGRGYGIVGCDDCRRSWDDDHDHDHGTHCAGIAGALANTRGILGISPDVTLHAVKAISADGRGSASSIAEGLRWVADRGYDVASLSLGSTSPSQVMRDAVRYASDRGVLVVAAAGNEEPDEDTIHYPAAYPEVVAVGATDQDDDLAEFSITGDSVELVAPGVEIPSTTIGDYRYISGTSMATPHVSGAAGLLRSVGLSRSETRERLRSTAVDIGLDADEQGNGCLDIEAALGDAGGRDAPDERFAVSTRGASGVEKTTATLTGRLDALGEQSTATVGFEYWVAGRSDATTETITVGERDSAGSFSAGLSGLASNTTYVVRAFAEAGDARVRGRQADFTTVADPSDLFAVATDAPSDIEDDEVELLGRLTDIDGPEEVTVGFDCWVAGEKAATRRRVEADGLDEPEAFDADLEELTPGTTYSVVAWGAADGVEQSGRQRTFTTGGEADDGEVAVSVETSTARDIEEDEAELVGRVTELSGVEEMTVGFEYWVRGERSATLLRTDTDEVDEIEAFDEDAEDLRAGTTYAFTAYCVADGTTYRGSRQEFTAGGTAEPREESVAVETSTARDIEEDEAELVGRITELAGVDEVTVGFEYWVKDERSTALRRTDTDEVDEIEAFDEDAEELRSGERYVFAAYCVADGTTYRGRRREFTAGGTAEPREKSVTVETSEVRDIEDDEAELAGRVTELSGVEEVTVGFEYWVEGQKSATLRRTDTDDVDEIEAFDEDAEELRAGTTYVAVATADGRRVRGKEVKFTTPSTE